MKNRKGLSILLALVIFVGSSFGLQQFTTSAVPAMAPAQSSSAVAAQTQTADELTLEDREKIDSWKYRPEDQVYLAYKEVFDNPRYYNQETGEINWPPNNGAVEGSNEVVVLEVGTQIDRYGSEDGYFTAATDTPYEQRSCAPGSDQKPYHQYEVLKPIEGVEQGITAPWFDEPGGGVQYMMPSTLEELVNQGFLKRIL